MMTLALKIFGYKPKQLNGVNFASLLQDNLEDILSNINSLKTDETSHIEVTGVHNNKSTFPLELTISVSASDGDTIYTIAIRDITDSKKSEEDLKYQAYFDQLTEIPNRTLFLDRAENALNQAKRSNEGLAIMFIDLDEFKEINICIGLMH